MTEKKSFRRDREVIDLLINQGIVTQEMLQKAREEAKRTGLSIVMAMDKLGIISPEEIVKVQADVMGIPYMDLTDYKIDAELIKLVPESVAKKYQVVPLFKIDNSLSVGMVDPTDIMALDQIRRVSQAETVEPILVSEQSVNQILNSYYGVSNEVDAIADTIRSQKTGISVDRNLIESAEEAPIIKLVNTIISQAVKDRASDIHIEPEGEMLRIRSRIDGLLHEVTSLPAKATRAVISRIKILAKMDIAESRKPQDGRIRLEVEQRTLDLRVSTFPTVHGENVVLRLLDRSAVLLGLKEVGLVDEELGKLQGLINCPNGIILVTGPTGSGKTSTLYAILSTINSIEKNIITIEDPVEYELPIIRQTQVNVKAGITFATGLRGVLRQDPDVIMVGEIRDSETASVAIQAALTGHQVFSTLHTNDAPSALTRLIDMGVEPFLISSSIVGIVAQRLVRLICADCKEKYSPSAMILERLGIKEKKQFWHGKGCDKCKGTGFIGRTGIFEVLVLDEEIRRLVDSRESADKVKGLAKKKGMKTLRDDGIEKIKSGLTTPEEVFRVTQADQ